GAGPERGATDGLRTGRDERRLCPNVSTQEGGSGAACPERAPSGGTHFSGARVPGRRASVPPRREAETASRPRGEKLRAAIGLEPGGPLRRPPCRQHGDVVRALGASD